MSHSHICTHSLSCTAVRFCPPQQGLVIFLMRSHKTRSTRDQSTITHSLQRWVSTKSSISQLTFFSLLHDVTSIFHVRRRTTREGHDAGPRGATSTPVMGVRNITLDWRDRKPLRSYTLGWEVDWSHQALPFFVVTIYRRLITCKMVKKKKYSCEFD